MERERERQIAATFVELADTLVADFDVVDFLHTLTLRATDLLDAADGGLMLADEGGGVLRVMASSSELARSLELLEAQFEQGPCPDCYRSASVVVCEDLTSEPSRWPQFTPVALAAGIRSVVAIPMRCRSQVIGALNLFRAEPGPLTEDHRKTGQAMADIATIGLLQERALREARLVIDQLQMALNSRVVIEQAKGVVAERAEVSVDQAFKLLRSYSRSSGLLLRTVAQSAIDGDVTVADLTRRPPTVV